MRIIDNPDRSRGLRALDTYHRLHGPDSPLSRTVRSVGAVSDVMRSSALGALAEPSCSDALKSRGGAAATLGIGTRLRRDLDVTLASVGQSLLSDLGDTGRGRRTVAGQLEDAVGGGSRHAGRQLTEALRVRTVPRARTTRGVFDEAVRLRAGARMPAIAGVLDEVTPVRASLRMQVTGVLEEALRGQLGTRPRTVTGLSDRDVRSALRGRSAGLAGLDSVFESVVGARRTLTGWQRAQLRTAERELLAARLGTMRTAGLDRHLSEQLRSVRALLASDVHLSHGSLAFGLSSFDGTAAMRALSADLLALVDTSWVTRAVADAQRLARVAVPDAIGRGRAFGIPRVVSDHHRNVLDAFPRTLVGTLSPGARPRMPPLIGLPSLAAVLPAEDRRRSLALGDDVELGDEAAIRAVLAVVLWTHVVGARLEVRRRSLAEDGRVVVAQVGDLLRELASEVTVGLDEAREWAWSVPLWALRARLALSGRLTADERLALRQRQRTAAVTTLIAAAGSILGPRWGADWEWVVPWLLVEQRLKELYEEIARVCHDHGLDELVPMDYRHDR